jgi:hypothetical protein
MENGEITKFEVGKTYATRSACDYDCIFDFEILDRTEKSVKVKVFVEIKTRRINMYNNVEQFLPHGRYSMCAIIRADMEMKNV